MKSLFARVVLSAAALLSAGASTACVDEARCEAVVGGAGVARARVEVAQRDLQIAWLRGRESAMASQMESASVSRGGDTLLRKVAALEAENAALTERLGRAERVLDEVRGKASASLDGAPAQAPTRRLDEAVPYDLTGLLTRPRPSPRRQAQAPRREPPRRLDETVPY